MTIIKYKTKEDKIGEITYTKHGTPIKLIAYRNVHDCDVEFQDEHKFIFKHAIYQNFIKGQIKNPYDKTMFGIGMLGDGKYKTSYIKGIMAKDYNIWQSILERCYINNDKYPAYCDKSTVCEAWLNFQVFAQWYEEQQYDIPKEDRLDIDKDILFPGNKVYSPSTCILVPQRINMLFSNKGKENGLPNGVSKSSNGKKFLAMYNGKHIGTFETLKEAYGKYANKKEETIRLKANEYKEYLPQSVYEALNNYKVCIENDKNYKGEYQYED